MNNPELLVRLEQIENTGMAYIGDKTKPTAKMTYSIANSKLMIIDHTEVSDAIRGRGAGKAMLEKLVEEARNKSMMIMPLCPFARKTFQKNPAYNDVLYS